MTELPENIEKYIRKHNAGDITIEGNTGGEFRAAVVVPVLNESRNLPALLKSLLESSADACREVLLLFVVNNTASTAEEKRRDNEASIRYLRDSKDVNALRIAWIDKTSEGNELPEKDGGVGLARKTGMDAALGLLSYSGNNPALVCLDGDCTVSPGYLDAVASLTRDDTFYAGTFEYEHPAETISETGLAIISYEIFLRYYLLGLSFAKSPYAFHTIGSTMVASAEAYVRAGGMNKRKAAEDFYFIQQLAKTGPLRAMQQPVVYPSSRPSDRVPFGTGQRVRRFLDHTHDEYRLYSPRSFEVLHKWNRFSLEGGASEVGEILAGAEEIHPQLHAFLLERGFAEEWPRVMGQSLTPEQLMRQKETWFDAFTTLKLIHHLRDTVFPDEQMFDAAGWMMELLGEEPPERSGEPVPDAKVQMRYLDSLRKLARSV